MPAIFPVIWGQLPLWLRNPLAQAHHFFGGPSLSFHASRRRELYTHIAIISGLASLFVGASTSLVLATVASITGGTIALRQFGRIFRKIWNYPTGKILYVALTIVTIQAGQLLSDYLIQLTLQTNPDLFPSLSRALMLLCALMFWVVAFYLLLTLSWVLGLAIMFVGNVWGTFSLARKHRYYGLGQLVAGLSFIAVIVPPIYTYSSQTWPKLIASIQNFIVLAIFVPNEVGGRSRADLERRLVTAEKRLICNNLPDDSYIYFFKTDNIFPDRVLEAYDVSTSRTAEADTDSVKESSLGDYHFRRSPCTNSMAPGEVRVRKSVTEMPKKE